MDRNICPPVAACLHESCIIVEAGKANIFHDGSRRDKR